MDYKKYFIVALYKALCFKRWMVLANRLLTENCLDCMELNTDILSEIFNDTTFEWYLSAFEDEHNIKLPFCLSDVVEFVDKWESVGDK